MSSLLSKPRSTHLAILALHQEMINQNLRGLPQQLRCGLVVLYVDSATGEWQPGFLRYQKCTVTQVRAYGPSEEAAIEIVESLAKCNLQTECRVLISQKTPNGHIFSFVTLQLELPKERGMYKRTHYAIDFSQTKN